MKFGNLKKPATKPMTLGTAQFGLAYGITNSSGKVPTAVALKIIRKAVAEGVGYIDTAAIYGDSEKVIGKAKKEILATDAKVITKVAPDEQRGLKVSSSS